MKCFITLLASFPTLRLVEVTEWASHFNTQQLQVAVAIRNHLALTKRFPDEGYLLGCSQEATIYGVGNHSSIHADGAINLTDDGTHGNLVDEDDVSVGTWDAIEEFENITGFLAAVSVPNKDAFNQLGVRRDKVEECRWVVRGQVGFDLVGQGDGCPAKLIRSANIGIAKGGNWTSSTPATLSTFDSITLGRDDRNQGTQQENG